MSNTSQKIWSDRVRRWKRSGLKAAEFAERHGLTVEGLYRWSWRLNAEARGKRAEQSPAFEAAPTFVEVVRAAEVVGHDRRPEEATKAAEPFEVVLGERVRVVVPARFDAESFARLVAVLERR